MKVKISQIKELTEKIVRFFQPEKIILFGSYGYGVPTPESDVDLLVILPFEGKSHYKSLEILNRTNPAFPIDLITRTPEQIRKRLAERDFFILEIIEKGKVLYESSNC